MRLQFDFKDQSYCFDRPSKIIKTHCLSEVIRCLSQVEMLVNQGSYAAGFIAYEAASAFQKCLQTHVKGELPLLWFALFDKVTKFPSVSVQNNIKFANWEPNVGWEEYQQNIAAIKNYIAEGHTYQVNYTLKMVSDFVGDPYSFYLHLLRAQRASYSAYLETEEFKILSASPELFFEINGCTIKTKPMKGTSPRGLTLAEDNINKNILKNSKNKSENLMITDLLRNDLGRIAQQGSIKVSSLFEVEKYPTVWQLTSTIEAQLKEQTSLCDIFEALFPCGSITGAPKIKTMELIKTLEKNPRGVYCGALGLITPLQKMLFSVPIRTITIQNKQATYGVGGGITWDSTSKDEYEEIKHKTKVLDRPPIPKHLLETLLLNEGIYFLYDKHLKRLFDSADFFDFPKPVEKVTSHLKKLLQVHTSGKWKIRLLLDGKGEIFSEITPVPTTSKTLTATWSNYPVHSYNVFLYHKTTEREFYPKVTLEKEALLYNEKEEITEFVNGNVLLLHDYRWLTPKLSCGVLNGTMRQQLIEEGKVKEAIIYKKDITNTSKLVFINSVRGWCPVLWKN
ncbi:Isochorismate synthase MenF [Commensalibacter sp. Nvir]|uniref:aminodeoxychorismate synthase component I n=1 Tax=Commensalibacter sp. Nvir TaxID=3069817 RepID=UPI002D399857|nr:Isochorismate synthase MenF [Commensalibacter sp. Nvir]